MVCVVDKQQILEQGTHSELLANPKGMYRKLGQLINHKRSFVCVTADCCIYCGSVFSRTANLDTLDYTLSLSYQIRSHLTNTWSHLTKSEHTWSSHIFHIIWPTWSHLTTFSSLATVKRQLQSENDRKNEKQTRKSQQESSTSIASPPVLLE